MSLKTQHELVRSLQEYESFRLVAFEALGGKKQSTPAAPEGTIGTFAELAQTFSEIGGTVG